VSARVGRHPDYLESSRHETGLLRGLCSLGTDDPAPKPRDRRA
jgi:hypothetical protein